MDIIGETPPAYANIDPSNFDKIFTQPKSNEDELKYRFLIEYIPLLNPFNSYYHILKDCNILFEIMLLLLLTS